MLVPSKAVSAPAPILRNIQEVIDELGETRRLKSLWKPPGNPHSAREAELLGDLAARYEKYPADQQAVVQGRSYELVVTPREFQRDLNVAAKEKIVALLRRKRVKFLDVFDTSLTAIRKCSALGEKWLDANVPKKRTGPREYRLTPLNAPAAARKAAA